MSLVSVTVIVFVLIPSISPIFIDAGLPLPGILSTFADIQDNWLSVIWRWVVAARSCFVLWRKAQTECRTHARHRSAEMLVAGHRQADPGREAGGFARALGTLLGARVPLMSAMQTARALVINRHLNALYRECDRPGSGRHAAAPGV